MTSAGRVLHGRDSHKEAKQSPVLEATRSHSSQRERVAIRCTGGRIGDWGCGWLNVGRFWCQVQRVVSHAPPLPALGWLQEPPGARRPLLGPRRAPGAGPLAGAGGGSGKGAHGTESLNRVSLRTISGSEIGPNEKDFLKKLPHDIFLKMISVWWRWFGICGRAACTVRAPRAPFLFR